MTSRIMTLVAFAILAGFLGILVLEVPRIDLGVIVAITLVLVAVDFFLASGRPRD